MRIRRRYRITTLQDLRRQPEEVAKRVRAGDVVIVMKHSRPLFRLIPPYETEERFVQQAQLDQLERLTPLIPRTP